MKKYLLFYIALSPSLVHGQSISDSIFLSKPILFNDEKKEELYISIEENSCPFIHQLPKIELYLKNQQRPCEQISHLCNYIEHHETHAPFDLVQSALMELVSYLDSSSVTIPLENAEQFFTDLEIFLQALEKQLAELETPTRGCKTKKASCLNIDYLSTCFATVKRKLVVNGNLIVRGNALVEGCLRVLGSLNVTIPNGCRPGPITIGTSDFTSLNLATPCTQNRLVINGNGAVTINTPDGGATGLTIQGGGEIINAGNLLVATGNIILPVANAAGTQGLFIFGGTGATNFFMYEIGTRNFFTENGTVNSAVTGTDNIGIGSSVNSTLTTASNTIALGNSTIASASGGIAIGSASGAGGLAARIINANAIAIGSANGTSSGADGSPGTGGVALGGADGVFGGALSSGNRSIAIGLGVTASSDASILIGSASGVVGGLGPSAAERTAIGIGSAQGALRAVNALNTSTIGIGGSDGVFAGAAPLGMRSIAIGANANTVGTGANGAITIGSSSGIAGGLAPIASAAASIALGSGSGIRAGANSRAAGSIAIGGSDGTSAGASATGTRSIAIGTGASIGQTDGILLGNAASTAVAVGIGTASPAAKLDVVGADGTPVITLNQVSTLIASAPSWQNPSTSAVAGTPIHYNASNQLFGFTSSKRYKTNIRPINNESSLLYQLNPVLYDPKEGHGEGADIPGLIAEDVFEAAPHLAILNSDNQPENVAYTSLHAFEVKEIQKHQEQLDYLKILIQNNAAILNKLMNRMHEMQSKLSNNQDEK